MFLESTAPGSPPAPKEAAPDSSAAQYTHEVDRPDRLKAARLARLTPVSSSKIVRKTMLLGRVDMFTFSKLYK
jgi:hypothetical protein